MLVGVCGDCLVDGEVGYIVVEVDDFVVEFVVEDVLIFEVGEWVWCFYGDEYWVGQVFVQVGVVDVVLVYVDLYLVGWWFGWEWYVFYVDIVVVVLDGGVYCCVGLWGIVYVGCFFNVGGGS